MMDSHIYGKHPDAESQSIADDAFRISEHFVGFLILTHGFVIIVRENAKILASLADDVR
jgi:hypothetical protein